MVKTIFVQMFCPKRARIYSFSTLIQYSTGSSYKTRNRIHRDQKQINKTFSICRRHVIYLENSKEST